MPMQRDVCPLVVNLPDGTRAELVPGSRPPAYSLPDRADAGIDVTIPDDLAATGWYWSGSFLYQPWPERSDGPGVAISTGTYGVAETFEMARRHNAKRGELLTLRAAKPAKKAKKARASIPRNDEKPGWDADCASNIGENIVEQMELAL